MTLFLGGDTPPQRCIHLNLILVPQHWGASRQGCRKRDGCPLLTFSTSSLLSFIKLGSKGSGLARVVHLWERDWNPSFGSRSRVLDTVCPGLAAVPHPEILQQHPYFSQVSPCWKTSQEKTECGDFRWGLMDSITLLPPTSLSTRTFTASLRDKGHVDWQPALPSPTRVDSQVPEATGEKGLSFHSKLD